MQKKFSEVHVRDKNVDVVVVDVVENGVVVVENGVVVVEKDVVGVEIDVVVVVVWNVDVVGNVDSFGFFVENFVNFRNVDIVDVENFWNVDFGVICTVENFVVVVVVVEVVVATVDILLSCSSVVAVVVVVVVAVLVGVFAVDFVVFERLLIDLG